MSPRHGWRISDDHLLQSPRSYFKLTGTTFVLLLWQDRRASHSANLAVLGKIYRVILILSQSHKYKLSVCLFRTLHMFPHYQPLPRVVLVWNLQQRHLLSRGWFSVQRGCRMRSLFYCIFQSNDKELVWIPSFQPTHDRNRDQTRRSSRTEFPCTVSKRCQWLAESGTVQPLRVRCSRRSHNDSHVISPWHWTLASVHYFKRPGPALHFFQHCAL